MRLTTRGNYAIAALLDMAIDTRKSHISLKETATHLEVSENYLRQLFMQLSRVGIVKSVRGVSGGYFINKNTSDITLLSIVQAVEGAIIVVPCLQSDDNNPCRRALQCSAKPIWQLLNNSIITCLEGITLEAMVNSYQNDFSD